MTSCCACSEHSLPRNCKSAGRSHFKTTGANWHAAQMDTQNSFRPHGVLRCTQDLLEGSTQVTLELMFAAVTPGSVENVEGPTRGVTRGFCAGAAEELPALCIEVATRPLLYACNSCAACPAHHRTPPQDSQNVQLQ